MIISMNSFNKLALLLLLSASISACGGNKKPEAQASVDTADDITRPPVIEKGTAPVEEAAAEGETVSFDEWRRRRDAAKLRQEQDQ